MKKLKIGNVELENRYILGPMAGVTDLPFRLLCKEQAQGFYVWKWSALKLLCIRTGIRKACLQFIRMNSGFTSALRFRPEDHERNGKAN